ncbi:hypothetical protein JCGZ_15763 [Jatropha curcas]|uniref:Uncharacterized protein n=1 Tax=Jatropha curcas TaxID=180498 RepID=A0A067KYT2_JATCU|nr:hypothetical protein JCGZ_15763 [Jatropha curcas]
MEDSGGDFPGFQTGIHKAEFEYRKPLSRLQSRAPYPLQIKPNSQATSSSSMAAVSSFNSFYHNKDPIPLLSPLVLPSLLQSAYVQEGNTANSH